MNDEPGTTRDIERALRGEPHIPPSGDFSSNVMRAVRHAAAEQEAIAFPWSRCLPGLALCVVLTIVAAAVVASGRAPAPVLVDVDFAWLESPLGAAAGWLAASLAGSWFLVRGALRAAGHQT